MSTSHTIMCTAKDAGMSRSRTGIMSTIYTTVTFTDSTRITTTNASHPATWCTSLMTMFTVKDVAMLRSRTGIMSTTCMTGVGTRLTAGTTTSTDADAFPPFAFVQRLAS
jgi:hypothetical protein